MARYRDFDVDLVDCGPLGYRYQYTHINYDGPEDDRAGAGFVHEHEANAEIDEWHRDRLIDDIRALRSHLRSLDDSLVTVMERDRFSTEMAFKMQNEARALIDRIGGMRKDS